MINYYTVIWYDGAHENNITSIYKDVFCRITYDDDYDTGQI